MHIGHDSAGAGRRVSGVRRALEANDGIARENRRTFARAAVTAVNLMSSPGAGKTSLLERLAELWRPAPPGPGPSSCAGASWGVLESDVQGRLDADRLKRLGVSVARIHTDPGLGGECPLDARMVRAGLCELPLAGLDLLVIENGGNLVCPAEFDVGEHARVMVAAVTEGEDKPLKYPLMYRASDLVLVNKIDLLPQLDFDLERFLANVDSVHPDVPCLLVSARSGEGVDDWRRWLEQRIAARRDARIPG